MDADEIGLEDLTGCVIGRAFRVGNTLGRGFVEKVYENALAYELRLTGLDLRQQYPIKVFYEGEVVGDFIADIVLEKRLLIEVKACQGINNLHIAQCLNYLKAARFSLCLIVNFGTPKVQIKRVALGL
jgi:GxxExxY protein